MSKNVQTKYCTIVLISHVSKSMLKILQARLQQYTNWELLDVQAEFRKGRGIRDQIANINWIIEKVMQFQKNIHFCFIDYSKAFEFVDHNKLWKILKDMGIPDHLTSILINLYANQETTVRKKKKKKQQLELDVEQWTGSKLGKEYDKGIYCHLAFNLYAEHIMWNVRLDESQTGIKIARRIIRNLIYADDTTLIEQSEEKVKNLLLNMKEGCEKAGLKFSIKKLRSWHPVISLRGK